ncbi:MAG: hypothetical protein ACI4LH_01805, partial [Candidatus Heritagella sp.]
IISLKFPLEISGLGSSLLKILFENYRLEIPLREFPGRGEDSCQNFLPKRRALCAGRSFVDGWKEKSGKRR